LQLARPFGAEPLRALTVAFEDAACLSTLIGKGGVYRGRKIESSIAVCIRTRELEERAGGWMQHVRLGRWRVRRWALERQLETQLLKSRIGDPKYVRTRAVAA